MWNAVSVGRCRFRGLQYKGSIGRVFKKLRAKRLGTLLALFLSDRPFAELRRFLYSARMYASETIVQLCIL